MIKMSLSKNKNLNDDLVKSNFIVGIDSMALYKAYICKNIFCSHSIKVL